MTRNRQKELFLLMQTQVAYATAVSTVTSARRERALADGDASKAGEFSVVLERLGRCEWQAAMDAADAAGFVAGSFYSLIVVSRQLGRLMSEMVARTESDDTQRIELQPVSSTRDRFMPTPEEEAMNCRTMWRMHEKRGDQLEATLGKVWHYMTDEAYAMTLDEVEAEFSGPDSAAVEEAVAAFIREGC